MIAAGHHRWRWTPICDFIEHGNSLRLRDGFLGLASVTLIHCAAAPMPVDIGGDVTRGALVAGLVERILAVAEGVIPGHFPEPVR